MAEGATNPDEKNKTEEAIKDLCQDETIKHGKKMAKFLRTVALDKNYRDVKMVRRRDAETGEWVWEEVQAPVPITVRVTAAKTWKEMLMDKAVGDVKEKAKTTREKGFNMKAAIDAIAKAKAKAKADEEDAPAEEDI